MEAFLDKKQRLEVGFTYVLSKLALRSGYGMTYLNTLQPYQDQAELETEFKRIALLKELINDNVRVFNECDVYFSRLKDVTHLINSLDYVELDEVEIFEIKKLVYNLNNIRMCFNKIVTCPSFLNITDYTDLFNYLDLDQSKQPFFSLYDGYHPLLKELRHTLKTLTSEDVDYLKTKQSIKDIEIMVKKEIAQEIGKYQEQLQASIEQLGYLDLLISKAKLALNYHLVKPDISNSIVLENAYNPFIKEIINDKGLHYIPLNMDIDHNINIITGSNMAGKSVSLKNIILNVLCFQYGIFPFASKASLPLLDYIAYISDELQDVSNSLSSFGKEIVVLNDTLNYIKNKQGLLVLDEFARGTNPIEAKMIVSGLIEYLDKLNAIAILATHLDLNISLEYAHYQVVGLDNYHENTFKDSIEKIMDYSLIKVDKHKKVPNDAFKVMNLLKLNDDLKEIIENIYEREMRDGSN
ncbi:MAG: hypothetical protein LBT75_05270 [Bacilli bacterium]|nr:hypothetical protein [Bacilli bacterium]